jgi:hypothetical protein
MAEPAVSPELLVTLTAALENLRTACRLPSGWKAVPSFRLTEKGASLLVVWRPTPASVAPRTKNNRRSPSSRQRSADRAAAHKTRKGQQSAPPQQQLRRSAPVFNMPIPPTPNPVPAAGQPAAEERERVGSTRMEVTLSKRSRMDGSGSALSSQPGPEPGLLSPWPTTKGEWQRLVDESGQLLVGAWERGDQGHLFDAECRTLDSLAGEGFARRLIQDCESRVRQIDNHG